MLKTADGERVAVAAGSIEDRRTSDVSLMPEGLAQTMTDQRARGPARVTSTRCASPVSIVGQYHVLGPLAEPAWASDRPGGRGGSRRRRSTTARAISSRGGG